ncbi:hypothetical protein MPSEU_000084200 [Mayamaea pseudoterrestris]|nr:hypothetical protein MPSEU_000084200 [Mayamaea pseudoterrestris]
MDQLTEALRIARFTDIVEVQVEDETVYLGASLDLANGGIRWEAMDAEERLSRHLQTKQWILPMLNDTTRNLCYQEAITKATAILNKKIDLSTGQDNEFDDKRIRVLDIGTGSGLLSLLAARSLSSPSVIHSLEMSSSMATLARRAIKANQDQIKDHDIHVLTEHSTEYQPEQRAHLCVSELLESGLLGEGVLPALQDAWDRLLDPEAAMVPQGARVYVAAVQGAWIQDLYGPQARVGNAASISYATSLPQSNDASACSWMLDASEVVYPVHAHHVFLSESDSNCRMLTGAKQVMDVSFLRDALLSGQQATSGKVTLTCTQAGTIHGILVWWELDLWDGIVYSLDPSAMDASRWQDHWKPCVHTIVDNRNVSIGDSITVEVAHDRTRIFVSICNDEDGNTSSSGAKRHRRLPREEERGNCLITPERALQLNDHERLAFYTRGINQALSTKGKDARILDVSDFSLCACIAARGCGATRVISLEGSAKDVPIAAARMCQLGNELPLADASFEIVQCQVEQLTLDVVGGTQIDIVLAEPYYEALEGWHLSEAINYYCIVRALRERGILAEDAISVPASCRVMACAIESHQLHSAYSACGDGCSDSSNKTICDFDHSVINEYGANFESHDLSLSMWQYDYKRISMDVEIGRLNFCNSQNGPVERRVMLSMTRKGQLDALLIWLEYQCSEQVSLSTADRKAYKQSVRMMNGPREVDTGDILMMKTSLLQGANSNGYLIDFVS